MVGLARYGIHAGTDAGCDTAPAQVLQGRHPRARVGCVRWWFVQIVGAWLVGVAGRAHEHTHMLDSSGTCERVNPSKGIPLAAARAPVFACKDCTFCGLTRRWGWHRILFLVRQDQGSVRPPVLRTCLPGEGNKKAPFWPCAASIEGSWGQLARSPTLGLRVSAGLQVAQ
jgi:hypothetical protein